MLTVCEQGMGKRSAVDEYRLIGRGGKGVINMKTTPATSRGSRNAVSRLR